MNNSKRWLLCCASVAAFSCGVAFPAYAQSSNADDSSVGADPIAEPQSFDPKTEIIVTGTNISGVKPVGSETIALDRNAILDTGLTNVSEVLNTLPQVQNNPNAGGSGPVYRQGGTSGYGGNPTQGTAINLRGLGTSATLTLVDGHRVVPSGASDTFTEAIQVPIAAVERIEIVSDGNSAIYGSDAISGVVNYVLRKDFDGLEVSGRDTFNDFYNTWGASVTFGKSWGSGNFIATYDYENRGSFKSSKSRFTRQDLRPLGGPDRRAIDDNLSVASPTLLVGGNGQPYSYYTIPDNAAPGVSFGDLTEGANLQDASDYTDFLGKQQRHQAAVFINQDLSDSLSAYVEAFYTHRDTSTKSYGNSRVGSDVTVCQGSPYYIADAPAAASRSSALCGGGLGQTVKVDPVSFFGSPSVTDNTTETISATAGLKAGLGSGWNADTYFTYAHDSTCGICNYDNNANGAALAEQIVLGNINPYSTDTLTEDQLSTFMGSNTQDASNTFYDWVLKFDGPVFDLPAGMVKTAFGGEWAHNKQSLVNGSNNAFENSDPTNNEYTITNDTTKTRTTVSAFAELFVPLVSDDMEVPLIQELNVDAAVRYDHYSDFGSTTNPKIGATWKLTDSLDLRGSWGTSFRAPSLTDTNIYNFSAAVIGVPWANNSGRSDIANIFPGNASGYLLIGANPDLKPETATTWSAGFDFSPVGSGFRFSGTYYSTKYSQQIIGQNTGLYLSSPENAALYSSYYTPVSNPGTCVNGSPSTYDPVLAAFIEANPALYNTPVMGACSVTVILDGRKTNAATTFQDGLDFQANYAFDSSVGNWTLSLNVTKILNQTVEFVEGAGKQDVLDTYYYPVSLRGRGQIGWNNGSGLGANLFVNYVGSYTNTIPLTGQPESKVPEWVTVDLGLNYKVPDDASILGGLRMSVNIQNLTDEDPPVVLTQSGNNYSAYDASNANFFGRTVSVQVTKTF
ncbi:TonB-dependent receptor [Altererythrobacter indicus]|uniref:TonB-dependent receptor n=1 Tax=Altericroceibacterium indicum TaxID=374177 RepID=A0A845A3Y4_9SPHN|nr:TonB-dependent receptor [Altericroceibacterium indicum]MXP24444.1 TonB-dependent receptor [Altericroceibacterium indicum]